MSDLTREVPKELNELADLCDSMGRMELQIKHYDKDSVISKAAVIAIRAYHKRMGELLALID